MCDGVLEESVARNYHLFIEEKEPVGLLLLRLLREPVGLLLFVRFLRETRTDFPVVLLRESEGPLFPVRMMVDSFRGAKRGRLEWVCVGEATTVVVRELLRKG